MSVICSLSWTSQTCHFFCMYHSVLGNHPRMPKCNSLLIWASMGCYPHKLDNNIIRVVQRLVQLSLDTQGYSSGSGCNRLILQCSFISRLPDLLNVHVCIILKSFRLGVWRLGLWCVDVAAVPQEQETLI